MAFTDDLITATSSLAVTQSGGEEFARFLPVAGKAYVLGRLGVGATNPVDPLDVEGALAVGTGYAGSEIAPVNGAIFEGRVGIGVVSPAAKLHVDGDVRTGNLTVSGDLSIGTPAVPKRLEVAGAIVPAAGNSENAGLLFPKNPGGGLGDAAWLRYYPRAGESMTLEIGIANEADDHISLMPSGNVGIGTLGPVSKLDVSGDIALSGKHAFRGNDAWLRLNQAGAFTAGVYIPGNFAPDTLNVGGANNYSNPGAGNAWVRNQLTVYGGVTPNASGVAVQVDSLGRLGTCGYSPSPRTNGWHGGIHTWDVEAEGTMWARAGYQSGARDLAENFTSDQDLQAGEVVSAGPVDDTVVRSAAPNDPLLLGVISTRPAVLLNVDDDAASRGPQFPVALSGRVPCKVVNEGGAIRKGDLLTSSSTPGHAMKAQPVGVNGHAIHRTGTIIGKALRSFDGISGTIEIFVLAQ